MRRVLIFAWGSDGSQYAGRSMTLYREPTVKFGGIEVGGIRISHLSHIDAPLTIALTTTRASRKPYTVQPLKVATSPAPINWAARLDESSKRGLEGLQSVWKEMPNDVRANLKPRLDKLKSEIAAASSHAAPSPAASSPSPAVGEVVPSASIDDAFAAGCRAGEAGEPADAVPVAYASNLELKTAWQEGHSSVARSMEGDA
jgi:hypothetical protein